ncbi:adenylate kinase 8 isoform X1 [Tympanuchus pallidicinctus]|uniref:adenylate kinase 8 isoform X1 n=2 Tax=Tympanuchus pallidicinctus TaxID=109042 RepID=UPI002287696A|nr:adenylate kinase 8 isoform X1 [Tympanuchus pallidicinctus]
MDAPARSWPPSVGDYAERQGLFRLLQNMLEELLIHKPEDPIQFMIEHLEQHNDDAPRIFILGPPASGKTTMAIRLCKHLDAIRISQETLLSKETLALTKEAKAYKERKQKIPNALWANLIRERLSNVDCIKQGWILEGFPENQEQARLLQSSGIIPRHVVVLYAADTMLIERNSGKRLDPLTEEVYHTTFDWPSDVQIQQRLVKPDVTEEEMSKQLLEYHRNFPGVFQTYHKILRSINADQPCVDVISQALTYVQTQPRSAAPFTPRILFCGPPGSGKSLQAALIAQKYGVVNICCGQLLKEAVADKTELGELVKPYIDNGYPVPDNTVMKILERRLNAPDCMTKGWVLRGFPRDIEQAERLQKACIIPNRVFFFNLPYESIIERLSQRRIDPVTGERYHTTLRPAPTAKIQARLKQNPKDKEENIEKRVDAYHRNVRDLQEFYEDAFDVNADQDSYPIFEFIESCIIKPLPCKKLNASN